MKEKKEINNFDVIVIGGGAAGMMAAGKASELGKKVLLLEKNKSLGEKLKITGGGRCNITNAEYDIRALMKVYGEAEDFLFSPFSQFGVKDTFEFFEKRGLPLVVQAGKRAFPKTEKAMDVYNLLENFLRKGGVNIKTNSDVKEILKENNKISGVKVGHIVYTANSYILATGGVSHAETGSTGDGFDWLRNLGHAVKTPTPTIVPIKVKETWIKSMPGITLSNIKITFYLDNKKEFSKKGNILCTHFGLSGPLILNSAGDINDLLYSGVVTAKVDFFPELDDSQLRDMIIKLFDENKNKIIKNTLTQVLPNGSTDSILSLLKDIDPTLKVHSVTKEQRKNLALLLKGAPITITGLMGFDKAVVADGGVILEEVDMKTIRSKIIENLFIIGDLLHINRPSGGYSLQVCWTTGHIAGSNA